MQDLETMTPRTPRVGTPTAVRPAPSPGQPVLRRVESVDDQIAISKAARAAGHQVIAPTHIVERPSTLNPQPSTTLGYASLNAMPILTGWLGDEVDDEQADAIVNALAEEARAQGLQWLAMPCTDDCRFKNRMASLGYRKVGPKLTLYLKVL